jgi:hypothetical protein
VPNDTNTGFMPVRGVVNDWSVHTPQSAAEVLSEDGYGKARSFRTRLDEEPDRPFMVNAINGDGLKIEAGDPLRDILTQIGKTHLVEVLPPGDRGFVPWTGVSHDPGYIVSIRISVRANAQAA